MLDLTHNFVENAVVLATRGYAYAILQGPAAPSTQLQPQHHGLVTMALSVKGSCSLLLGGVNGGLDDRPSTITFGAGYDCNNPVGTSSRVLLATEHTTHHNMATGNDQQTSKGLQQDARNSHQHKD
jgi:hypothetical protein